MNKAFKLFFICYITPIFGMSLLAPYFIEHFLYKDNEYLLNYQTAYAIFVTLMVIGFGFIALISFISKSAQYTTEQIDNMREGKKKTFIGKYIYKPIHWILYAGLVLTGHFYLAIMLLIMKSISVIISKNRDKVIADYDKNIADQATGKVPLKTDYRVME